MALVDLSELAAVLATRRYRLLGLDLGTKTIGLAISDGLGLSATPVETIRRTKFTADVEALLKLCKAREVATSLPVMPL